MRAHINRLSKPELLCPFRDAFHISIAKSNVQGGFCGAGLVPYDPERVLSKLDGYLRTPSPAGSLPDSTSYWVSKTPQNTIEATPQSTLIKNRIINHLDSLPTSTLNAVDHFTKGATANMIHEVAPLRAEVSSLCKANEGLSKRRIGKRT